MSPDGSLTVCILCGGGGLVRCDRCGGRGQTAAFVPPAGPAAPGDELAGRWLNGDGSWLVFERRASDYTVQVGSPHGKAGSGTATRESGRVHLDLRVLFLRYRTTLEFDGDTLRGTIPLGPVRIPVRLTRA
jgi:hypothetical protein